MLYYNQKANSLILSPRTMRLSLLEWQLRFSTLKKVGRNNLYKILFEKKLIDHNNMPYQKYIDRGLLVLGSQEFTLYGNPALRYVPKITHKGLEYIMNLLIDLGYKQREDYQDFNPYDIDFSQLSFYE